MIRAPEWTGEIDTGDLERLIRRVQRDVLESAAQQCDVSAESYEDRSDTGVECARELARVIRGMKP